MRGWWCRFRSPRLLRPSSYTRLRRARRPARQDNPSSSDVDGFVLSIEDDAGAIVRLRHRVDRDDDRPFEALGAVKGDDLHRVGFGVDPAFLLPFPLCPAFHHGARERPHPADGVWTRHLEEDVHIDILMDKSIPSGAGGSIKIPQTSKRIDFIIIRKDRSRNDTAVIVELD